MARKRKAITFESYYLNVRRKAQKGFAKAYRGYYTSDWRVRLNTGNTVSDIYRRVFTFNTLFAEVSDKVSIEDIYKALIKYKILMEDSYYGYWLFKMFLGEKFIEMGDKERGEKLLYTENTHIMFPLCNQFKKVRTAVPPDMWVIYNHYDFNRFVQGREEVLKTFKFFYPTRTLGELKKGKLAIKVFRGNPKNRRTCVYKSYTI